MKTPLLITALSLATISASCQPWLEAKAGYFFFTESKMKKVYDQGGIDAQISMSYPIYDVLQVCGSVEFFEKTGRSLNGHQKTKIWAIPFSMGLQPVFSMGDNFKYYFSVGPKLYFAHANNRSSYVVRRTNSTSLGGFANTGFQYVFKNHLMFDLFGEYSYVRMKFHSDHPKSYGEKVQLSGLTFGGGIGYSF